MAEREPELLIREVIDVEHDQGVLVALVHWHEYNSSFPVLQHIFDAINTLNIDVETLDHVAHYFTQEEERRLGVKSVDFSSEPS